jgi:hypothetical protein
VSAAAAFINVAQFTLKTQTDSGPGHTPACEDFIFRYIIIYGQRFHDRFPRGFLKICQADALPHEKVA